MKKSLMRRLQAQFPPLLDPQTNMVVVNAHTNENGRTTVQVPHRNGQRRVLDAWRKLPPKLRAAMTEVLDAFPDYDIVKARDTLSMRDKEVFDKAFMIEPAAPPASMMPVKGETLCNRTACQTSLGGDRWWNTSTQAFYCRPCARRINRENPDTQPPLCVPENERLST